MTVGQTGQHSGPHLSVRSSPPQELPQVDTFLGGYFGYLWLAIGAPTHILTVAMAKRKRNLQSTLPPPTAEEGKSGQATRLTEPSCKVYGARKAFGSIQEVFYEAMQRVYTD